MRLPRIPVLALALTAATTALVPALAPATAQTRTLLLHSQNHPPVAPITPTFTNREAWKAERQFK